MAIHCSLRQHAQLRQSFSVGWSTPITHIAKDFGLSDKGISKHCVKNDKSTLPLSHWARLANGKRQQSLNFRPDYIFWVTVCIELNGQHLNCITSA